MRYAEFRDVCRGDIAINRERSGLLSVATVVVFRLGQYGYSGRGPFARLAGMVYRPLDFVWTKLLIGADIPAAVTCGPRLVLAHGGRGVFLNERTVLGSDVTIQQQVTIGIVRGEPAAPRIGSAVNIGAKASILGAVRIDDGATVGAHAVVTRDVPAGKVALGVPARIRDQR